MNYKFLLPVLATVFMLNSCSKDGSEDSSPDVEVRESYQTSNTMVVDQVALHTKNGIETNTAIIQSFLNRHFPSDITQKKFALNATTVTNPDISFTLEFLKGNKVRFRNKLMDITQSGETLIWITETDSSAIPPISPSACGVLMDKATIVTPRSDCSGASDCSKYRKSYPIQIADGEYFIPVMHYVSSTWYPEIRNGVEVSINCTAVAEEYPTVNLINPDVRADMNARDTVLVQIGRLPMLKKP